MGSARYFASSDRSLRDSKGGLTVLLPSMNATPYLGPAVNSLARGVLGLVRAPVVGLLILLEPVVNVVCGVMTVLGLLAAVAFEFSAVGPRFPFLQVAAISLAFGLLLVVYHSAIALLVRE